MKNLLSLAILALLTIGCAKSAYAGGLEYGPTVLTPNTTLVAKSQTPTVPITQAPVSIPVNIQAYYDFSAGKGQPKVLGAFSTNVAYTALPNKFFFAINPFVGGTFSGATQLVGGASLSVGTSIGNLIRNAQWNGINVCVSGGLASYAGGKVQDVAGVSVFGTLKF